MRALPDWFEDICEEDCPDVEVDEGAGVGVEICAEVVGTTVDADGVNKFVLTTIFEKSKTGGKLGSVGPGPITGGLFTFAFDDWVDDDPDKLDVWDEDEGAVDEVEGVGEYFEVEGEFVDVELGGVTTFGVDEVSVFFTELMSLFFVLYELTVNCLFGKLVGKLFFPLSVGAGLFVLVLWMSLVLLLLAEFELVCPDDVGLEAVVVEGEMVFCVCEIVGLLGVGSILSVLIGVYSEFEEAAALAIDVRLAGFMPRSAYVKLSDPNKAVRSINYKSVDEGSVAKVVIERSNKINIDLVQFFSIIFIIVINFQRSSNTNTFKINLNFKENL